MLVVLWPAFFYCEYSLPSDMCTQVVFFPEALRDPEVWFVVIPMGAWLFIALSVYSESFGLSVIVPVGSDICIKNV